MSGYSIMVPEEFFQVAREPNQFIRDAINEIPGERDKRQRQFITHWSVIFKIYMSMTPEDQARVQRLVMDFDDMMFVGGPSQQPLNDLIDLFGLKD